MVYGWVGYSIYEGVLCILGLRGMAGFCKYVNRYNVCFTMYKVSDLRVSIYHIFSSVTMASLRSMECLEDGVSVNG